MPKSSKKGAVLTAQQIRAARGWLAWSQEELAKRANVALRTVASFERGEQVPRPNNLIAIRHVIEEAGVRLLFDDEGKAAGVARTDTIGKLARRAGRSKR
jgi:transcriptional regulator with XRE-family HTH domain